MVMRRMSMPVATRVDVGSERSAATVGRTFTRCPEDLIAMTPIAAYYVMLLADHERTLRSPRFDSIVPKVSLAARIVAALEVLVRLGRPATTQPT
jgi:hypothetical protein